MENASKALIIAASILIAIILITLGVIVVNKGKSAIGDVNLTDQEVSAFNSKWEGYEGTQLGSVARTLVKNVNNYNRTANDGRYIAVVTTGTGGATNVDFAAEGTVGTGDAYDSTKYNAGGSYKVAFDYTKGGLISKIYIVKQN